MHLEAAARALPQTDYVHYQLRRTEAERQQLQAEVAAAQEAKVVLRPMRNVKQPCCRNSRLASRPL